MSTLAVPLAILLSSVAADAETQADQCTITAEKGDRVRKGGDVVVNAGEVVADALAIEGNVTVKSGATAKSAIALHGSVTVEEGATITGSVIAIGGKLHVSKKANVSDSQISLDDTGLHVVSDDGDDFHINAVLNSRSLAKLILKPALAKLHGCMILAEAK